MYGVEPDVISFFFQIANNKQIMYDCDKGYILGERGPPGATCVGGLWRPTELPSCLPGLHPRLRWNRRKRSLQIHAHRSQYLLRNIRQLQRKLADLLDDMHTMDAKDDDYHRLSTAMMRARRMQPMFRSNWLSKNNRRKRNALHKHSLWSPSHLEFMQRDRRNRNGGHSGGDPVYNRYFQMLKQNHIDYINAMFRSMHNQNRLNGSHYDDDDLIEDTGNNYADHIGLESAYDGRARDHPLNANLNHQKLINNDYLFGEQRMNQHHRPNVGYHHSQQQQQQQQYGSQMLPIPFPNINENLSGPQTKKLDIGKSFANNTYSERKTWKFSRENQNKNTNGNGSLRKVASTPVTVANDQSHHVFNDNDNDFDDKMGDLIAKLQSQTYRRKKRSPDEDASVESSVVEPETRPGRRRKFNQTLYDPDDSRKGKSKEPCEASVMQ